MSRTAGTSNAFSLQASSTPSIPYSVAWNQTTGQTTGTALTASSKSTKFISSAVATDCAGGSSATLLVSIAGSDAAKMTAGTAYSGTLTLLVSPG